MDAERRRGIAHLLQRQRETLLRHLAAAMSVNGSLTTRCEPGTPCASLDTSGSAAAGGRTRQALDRVDAALARLAAGSYGICTTCGREIALGRLSLVPATAYCVRCARHASRADRGVTHFTAALAKF